MLLYLRLQAPFATFREFSMGKFRGSAAVIPPTAALGLLYNFAAIDSRGVDLGSSIETRRDTPRVQLAIGMVENPVINRTLLQAHVYTVGNGGASQARLGHGQKTWITPVNVESVAGFDCVLAVESDQDLGDRVEKGVNGLLSREGIPTAGDGGLIFDDISMSKKSPSVARWLVPFVEGAQQQSKCFRLPVWIDRKDSSKTVIQRYKFGASSVEPPSTAWLQLPFDV